MHLVRILVFLAAHFDFWFVAKHVEGTVNSLANDLSRDNLPNFFSQDASGRVLQTSSNSTITPGPPEGTTTTFGHPQIGSSCSGILYSSSDTSNTQDL